MLSAHYDDEQNRKRNRQMKIGRKRDGVREMKPPWIEQMMMTRRKKAATLNSSGKLTKYRTLTHRLRHMRFMPNRMREKYETKRKQNVQEYSAITKITKRIESNHLRALDTLFFFSKKRLKKLSVVCGKYFVVLLVKKCVCLAELQELLIWFKRCTPSIVCRAQECEATKQVNKNRDKTKCPQYFPLFIRYQRYSHARSLFATHRK